MAKEEKKEYHLKVKVLHEGQPRPYADHLFHYLVEDSSSPKLSEQTVLTFCKSMLRMGYYEKDMPGHFYGQILSFRMVAEGVAEGAPNIWEYKVREAYTG